MGEVIFIILIWLILIGLIAWPVMLLIGAIHASYAAVPAIGFWVTYAIVLVLKLIF